MTRAETAVLIGLNPPQGERVVEFRFNAEEWAKMTLEHRIKRCTILAEEAQKLADQADERYKPLYMDLAVQWLTLATEIGRAATPSSSYAAE